MATTSILASRPLGDDDGSLSIKETDDEGDQQRKDPFTGSQALLKLLEIVGKSCVGITRDLEPFHHSPTLGEGLSFSVKKHIRKQSGHYVLKVFKYSLVAGQSTVPDFHRVRALLLETHILGHRSIHENENIVTLVEVAFAIQSSNPLQISPALVLEMAPHGTLDAFQRSKPKSSITWATRKMLAYDVAAGIKALHECGVVHGDLKPDNILIFDHPVRGYIAKISDFGSAVILPSDATTPEDLRLPAYTPPWNAPEATSYLKPQHLPLTDVYSLGLVIWSILIHGDPFLSFDLPLHPDVRREQKRRILTVPNIAGSIPHLIETDVGVLAADEILLLVQVFSFSIHANPECRSLDRIMELLEEHNGRPDKVESDKETQPGRVSVFDQKIDQISARISWTRHFHHLVQTQILHALEDISGLSPVRQGFQPKTSMVKGTVQLDIIWIVFQCHLLGIGTRPDPKIALGILFHASQREEGDFLPASVIVTLTYKSLGELVVDNERSRILSEISKAATKSDFWFNLLRRTDRLELKRADDHGFRMSRADFLKLSARLLGSVEPVHGSRTPGIVDIGGKNTLLHLAAFYNDANLATYLLDADSIGINAQNESQETAVLIACRYDSCQVLDVLLRHGADASIEDQHGDNGLQWLSSIEDQSREYVARRLHENGAELKWSFSDPLEWDSMNILPPEFFEHGRVPGGPLMQAIARNDLDSVKALLSICLELDVEPISFIFCLFPMHLRLAAELHLSEILEYLCLKLSETLRKAEPLASLIELLREGREDSTDFVGPAMLEITRSTSILRGAIAMSHHPHRLCFHGDDWTKAAQRTASVLDKFGLLTQYVKGFSGSIERVLNNAIASGNHEFVKFLLSQDKILNIIDEADEGCMLTPVHEALNSRNLEMFQLLVQHGATLDLRKNRDPNHNLSGVGASYLHLIASLRVQENAFAEILLDSGIPPDIKDDRGVDAFGLAMNRSNFALAELLLRRGYNLKTRGYYGLTVLGERIIDSNAQQHDDVLEAVRFLLKYDGPEDDSLFIVDPINNQSVLHVMVGYPLADETRYRDLLRLVLSHFNKPHQIDARSNSTARSTVLQMAIAMRNPVAVIALVEAGADIEICDASGRNMMTLARHAVVGMLAMDAASKPKDAKRELDQAFRTVSALANRKSWPEDLKRNHAVKKALEVAKPTLDQMIRMSHQEAYASGLETKAFRLVASQVHELPESIEALEDFRREVDSILSPCLYADLAMHICPDMRWATNQSMSYPLVRQRIPWTRTISDAWMSTLQQAAAFEWLLDEIRQRNYMEQDQAVNWFGLSRFARTGDPAHLPMDHRFIRWPPALLDWYIRAVREDQVELDTQEKGAVAEYIKILRSRARAQADGNLILPPFNAEFRNLHFELLQPDTLDFDTIDVPSVQLYRCRCYREAVPKWHMNLFESISREPHTDDHRSTASDNFIGVLQEKKREELERKGETLRFKHDIGVLGAEGQIERTGVRRRNSELQVMTDLEEQMMKALMQQLGLSGPPPERSDKQSSRFGGGFVEDEDSVLRGLEQHNQEDIMSLLQQLSEQNSMIQGLKASTEGTAILPTSEEDVEENLRSLDVKSKTEQNSSKDNNSGIIETTEISTINTESHTEREQEEEQDEEMKQKPNKNPAEEEEKEKEEEKTKSQQRLFHTKTQTNIQNHSHVKSALGMYMFHLDVDKAGAEIGRDRKYALTHARDVASSSSQQRHRHGIDARIEDDAHVDAHVDDGPAHRVGVNQSVPTGLLERRL